MHLVIPVIYDLLLFYDYTISFNPFYKEHEQVLIGTEIMLFELILTIFENNLV
jgi:hypothetical protein